MHLPIWWLLHLPNLGYVPFPFSRACVWIPKFPITFWFLPVLPQNCLFMGSSIFFLHWTLSLANIPERLALLVNLVAKFTASWRVFGFLGCQIHRVFQEINPRRTCRLDFPQASPNVVPSLLARGNGRCKSLCHFPSSYGSTVPLPTFRFRSLDSILLWASFWTPPK